MYLDVADILEIIKIFILNMLFTYVYIYRYKTKCY